MCRPDLVYTIAVVAQIRLDGVTKTFGAVRAVDDVSLEIRDGEFLVLVGPSGCGKSTLLRMIAGLEESSEGEIRIGERDVTDLPPRSRDIAMVFQSYALYPHMTVRQNLGYGLKARRTPKPEIAERVDQVADLLGLAELLDRRPAQLSGGQRQRVAMGRAIVRQPQAFLLDEPLSNLDAKLRVGMRASLAQLHRRLGVTTVYVTHDQTEAMTLGQRVAVMRDGRILQCDRPQVLYARPANLFIAAFIGSPAMNLVEAVVDGSAVRFGQYLVPLNRPPRADRVVLGIRPESFEDAAFAPGLPTVRVEVEVLEELGSDAHVFFHVDAPPVTAEVLEAASDGGLLPETRAFFTARVDARTGGRVGSMLELAVDPARFHYFDPGHRRAARPRRRRGAGGGRLVTKQRETRERVLELIEPLEVGDSIPSERQLSVDWGVSRLTVRAALEELVREGYLVRKRGAGTFVAEPKVAKGIDIASFSDDMRARGLQPGSRTLDLREIAAGARLGRILHVSPAEPILSAKRLRLADGEPMAIELLHVRSSLVPGLSARDLEENSFYDLLSSRFEVSIVGGTQTVEPTVTNEEESAALGVPLHSPALLFERVTRTSTGEVVEYTSSTYRGDRYRLVTEIGVGGRPLQPLAMSAVERF